MVFADILKKYNDPETFAAIIMYACYNGRKKVRPLSVPLVYSVGEIGPVRKASYGVNPTIVVEPRRRKV